MSEFKHFDVVSDDSDHHFRGSANNIAGNTRSRAYKSIMKEWKILEQHLPESIYVRVYEGRIDLMRAVVIGAAGTPYRDGLFFFDILFPSSYPNNPPNVHFTSFGLHLNPNLYPSGIVCLSLLNTWDGNKSEMWDSSLSTCLQLLLSLQALVLNEKPYFNEPYRAFGPYIPYITNGLSRDYSEHVYGLTCQLTLHLLRKPPKNFDAFVKGYFRDHAPSILAAFIEYAAGRVSIGYYRDTTSSSPSKVSVSRRYKTWAQEFYPLMFDAFELCGASLNTFARVLPSENKRSTISNAIAQIKAFWQCIIGF